MESNIDGANFNWSKIILVANVDVECIFFLILRLMRYFQNYFSYVRRNTSVALPHVRKTLEMERFP